VNAEVEAFLKDVQNAVSARHLYPPEHPRVREGMDRIESQLRALTRERGELSVFSVDDKVIHDGNALPGGEPLTQGLFHLLRGCGYDRITIRRGVSREELEAFVAGMGELVKRPDPAAPGRGLRPSINIRLSSLQLSPEGEEKPPDDGEFLRAEVGTLGNVWSGVLDSRRLDFEAVQGIVIALSKAVEENLGAMIPMAALKSYDEYTATHIINVALLAMGLAEAIDLPDATVHDVGIAALLHDVGKLRVPAEILNNTGKLTDEQFGAIRRHPEDGARILLATPGVPELAVVVAYEHHIRFDGGGYPAVPAGWKCSLGSAITQVADIYDALRTDRPYRAGLPRERIIEMMTGDAGTHFDPALLDVFFERVISRTAAVG
jgi:HD-GYP domain-containing protein (c-di-GMP phosphodiesterase class II)